VLAICKQRANFPPVVAEQLLGDTLAFPFQYGSLSQYWRSSPRVMGVASNPGTASTGSKRAGGEITESIVGEEAKQIMRKIWEEFKQTSTVSAYLIQEIKKRNEEYFIQGTAHGFFSSLCV
jgi:hypothetical protein